MWLKRRGDGLRIILGDMEVDVCYCGFVKCNLGVVWWMWGGESFLGRLCGG